MSVLEEAMAETTCPACDDRWSSHCRECHICHAPSRRNQYRCGCTAQAPKRARSPGANLWNGPLPARKSA